MLVSDLQARNPPPVHVRVLAICYVDAAPSANAAFIAVIEVLQTVQVVKIPDDGSVLAVNLQRIERLVPPSVPRRFERAQ